MRILTVAAEAAPFAKTGGLADVTTCLTKALSSRGHETAIILPKYLMVDRAGYRTEPIDLPLLFRVENEERTGWIHRATLPGTQVEVFFVVNDHFFNRNGIYHENGKDYPDNLARFAFFCRGVVQLLKSGEFEADIVHCHDWQSALVPAYLKTSEREDPKLSRTRTVFTFHNLAYQGFFPRDQYPVTGLPWSLFTPEGMEFFGDVNLLKGGLIYADALTTVSERYAAEVMTPEYGRGMETVIHANRHRLSGILNGVDYTVWNPAVDTTIPAQYTPDDLSGKEICKTELQKEFGLPTAPHIPLLTSLSRFDDPKGIELVLAAMEVILLEGEIQLVLQCEGKPEFERHFVDLITRFPTQVSLSVGPDEDRAHRMIAGSDFYLMPSRYEPCGFGQLYSLKYGTPAILRQAGGLADAIRDYNDAQRDGYGFVFHQPDPKDFIQAIRRALSVYRDKTAWVALQRRGMARDFSWERTAERYDALFHQLLEPQS